MNVEIVMWAEVIAVVVAGVFVGSKVQKCARFLYPYDCLTISILTLIAADLVAGISGIQPMWYASLLFGYITGYLVVGRTSYIMVMEMDLAGKHVEQYPLVIWNEGTHTFIQEQTNRALLRRLIFGVKHELYSNVPLDLDWRVDAKYPMFPLFSRKTVMVEDSRISYTPEHAFWRFSVRRYSTEMVIAYAGMVSKMQLAQDESYLRKLQKQNIDLAAEVDDLRSRQGPMLMEAAIAIDAQIGATSPINRMYNLMNRKKENRNEPKESKGQEDENVDGEADVQVQP